MGGGAEDNEGAPKEFHGDHLLFPDNGEERILSSEGCSVAAVFTPALAFAGAVFLLSARRIPRELSMKMRRNVEDSRRLQIINPAPLSQKTMCHRMLNKLLKHTDDTRPSFGKNGAGWSYRSAIKLAGIPRQLAAR